MKIGIISTIGNLYNWAGSEEMWYGMAQDGIKNGNSFLLAASSRICNSSQVKEIRKTGVKVFERKELSPIYRRLVSRNLFSRFKEFFVQNPDVILISMGGVADSYWMEDLIHDLYKSGIPYVVLVQANAEGIITNQKEREVLNKFYKRAQKVIFVSEHNLMLAKRQLCFEFSNSTIIANPLRASVANTLKWPKTDSLYRLAQVARLEVRDKQQDHLLEALSTDNWKNRNWHLTFYGTGPDREYIEGLIGFYGLENKVSFGGFLNSFEDIWSKEHLHVMPSRREGMPLSMIESMACGRPGLLSHVGGVDELIEHSITGFRYKGMHPKVLSECLEEAWIEREKWEVMGLNASRKIKTIVSPNWRGTLLNILEDSVTEKK